MDNSNRQRRNNRKIPIIDSWYWDSVIETTQSGIIKVDKIIFEGELIWTPYTY